MPLAVLMGAAQALVFPSTIALVSARVDERSIATGMGLVGTMKNAGKVAGPVITGGLIHWLDYAMTFRLMGVAMLLGAMIVWRWAKEPRTTSIGESTAEVVREPV